MKISPKSGFEALKKAYLAAEASLKKLINSAKEKENTMACKCKGRKKKKSRKY